MGSAKDFAFHWRSFDADLLRSFGTRVRSFGTQRGEGWGRFPRQIRNWSARGPTI